MPSESHDALLEAVRAVLLEIMQTSMRPSVVSSESGVSSVKLNATAKGFTQTEVKVYHEDPHEAARLANAIYEAELVKWGTPQA